MVDEVKVQAGLPSENSKVMVLPSLEELLVYTGKFSPLMVKSWKPLGFNPLATPSIEVTDKETV